VITRDGVLLAAAAQLRREVFVGEQGVPAELEFDGADATAVHAVRVDGGVVVATGRLVDEGGLARLGRIAVRADRRGSGLGARIVDDLVRAAAAGGLPRMRLHAQEPVVPFYERLGWQPVGAADLEAGIAHRWMERDLLPGLRPVADSDAEGLQALVGGCFAEYENCVLELDGLDAWMRAPASGYAAKRGGLLVLPNPDGGLLGSAGWQPAERADAIELKTMYVDARARRGGTGSALLGVVERSARERGARRVELWTDTRFTAAHRFYEAAGYVREPGSRELHDLSQTTEIPYSRGLAFSAGSGSGSVE
jgi:GNAT superfamily N-acetyltransferase